MVWKKEDILAPATVTWSDYTLSNPIEDIEVLRRRVMSEIGYTSDMWDSPETSRKRLYAFLDAAERHLDKREG